MSDSRNKKPYQILVENDRYLLECQDKRFVEHPKNPELLEVGTYEQFMEDIVDCDMSFVRKHTRLFDGYWDANFWWGEIFNRICNDKEVIRDEDDQDGEWYMETKLNMAWGKTYYLVEFHSYGQGDSGSFLYSEPSC